MIPLKFKGEISQFDTRIPTQHELSTYAYVVLTRNSIWDPSGLYLEHQEKNIESNVCDELCPIWMRGGRQLFAMHYWTKVSTLLRSVLNALQDDSLLEKLEDSMKVKLPSRNVVEIFSISNKRHH